MRTLVQAIEVKRSMTRIEVGSRGYACSWPLATASWLADSTVRRGSCKVGIVLSALRQLSKLHKVYKYLKRDYSIWEIKFCKVSIRSLHYFRFIDYR